MIKTSYDPAADAMFIWLAPEDAVSVETREIAPGVMLDYDAGGRSSALRCWMSRNGLGAPHLDRSRLNEERAKAGFNRRAAVWRRQGGGAGVRLRKDQVTHDSAQVAISRRRR